MWKQRKVLVTGADGFIGSHLVEALAAEGAQVTALAHYNSFDHFGWLDDLPAETRGALSLARGDIRDGERIRTLCRGQATVFHLAALIGIPYSYESPSSYVATNVQGTVNVLTAARDAGVERVVHTSTSEVYGTARHRPIGEDHPLQGQSPYSASKIAADMMAEAFSRSFGLPVVTLRPFNTYGPRQSERAVIPTIVRQALDGETICLGDLTPSRDFTYVADMTAAFLAAARLDGGVFNAGGGRMVSIGDVVAAVRAITGHNQTVVADEARRRPADSEVMALQADAGRLAKATGWTPTVSLEQGLRRTVDWWRGRMDRIRPDSGYMT